ncbi:MAG: hypothetical protein IT342_04235 [Candidatus Melainabacteria bacterium]|nr:hypothetical protein [Candidatus Melainabacteria bacterium]
MAKLIGQHKNNSTGAQALSLMFALNLLSCPSLQTGAQDLGRNGQSEPTAQAEQSSESDPENSPTPEMLPQEDAPGQTQQAETPPVEASSSTEPESGAERPPQAEAPQSEPAASSPAPIPNADATAPPKRTFGAVEISGNSEAMGAAQNPAQSKVNKQLIESLRDVFPINGNPLKDLFTPQPQYVTPQTLMNPQPEAPRPGEANPLKGLFTPQPQYITPQTLINPEPNPPIGEMNHFKGVFTAQPQYITPQTIMNPHVLPRYYVKERLPDHFFESGASAKKAQTEQAETQLGPSKSSDYAGCPDNHPLRQAMLLMNSARETHALALIDRLLVQYPGNFQARYVKAVALVRLRRFGDARQEYMTILKFSFDVALKKLAQEGLAKLTE